MPLILVIEQEQRYVERIEEALSPQGWEVVGVHDQASAMRMVADRAADLVVLNAEVEDASEMVEAFSRANGGPGAVVLLPESGDNGVAQRGADEVLQKPFTDRDIRLAVRRCFSASRDEPEEVIEEVPSEGERLSSAELFGEVVLELEGVFNQAGGVSAEAEATEVELPVAGAEAAEETVAETVEPEMVESAVDESVEGEIDAVLEGALAGPASEMVEEAKPAEESVEEEPTAEEEEEAAEEPAEELVAAAEDEPTVTEEEEVAGEAVEVSVEELEEYVLEVEAEEPSEELVAAAEDEPAEEYVAAEVTLEEEVEEEELAAVAQEEEPELEEAADVVEDEEAEREEAAVAAAVEEPPVVEKRDEKQFLEQRLQEAVLAGKAAAEAKQQPAAEDLDSVRTADLLLQKALATVVPGGPTKTEIDAEFIEPAHATDEEVDALVSTVVGRPKPAEVVVEPESPESESPQLDFEEGEVAPALDVVESEHAGRDEGEYRARMKLVWAIILIALLALLAFVVTRQLGDDATQEPAPIGASESPAGSEPVRPSASGESAPEEGLESGAAEEAGEASDDAPAGADTVGEAGVDREARLRRELEAERRQLQDEIERTKADTQQSDSEEDGGGVQSAGALIL